MYKLWSEGLKDPKLNFTGISRNPLCPVLASNTEKTVISCPETESGISFFCFLLLIFSRSCSSTETEKKVFSFFMPLSFPLSLSLWSCDFAVKMSNSAGIWAAASTLHKALSLSRSVPENKKVNGGVSPAARLRWMNSLPEGRTEQRSTSDKKDCFKIGL